MSRDGVRIGIAPTDAEIARCFPVMLELRPHVVAETFVARIRARQREGYTIAALEANGEVRAVTGFRINDILARGRNLYEDDLVTAEASRSRAHGSALLRWLVQRARDAGCEQFDLDSGVQRHRVHRFYFREGMHINSYHFTLSLRGK